MNETSFLHDLILFLTAVFAAYAAYKTRTTSAKVDTVMAQTDGLARDLAKSEHSLGKQEGIEEGRRANGAPPEK